MDESSVTTESAVEGSRWRSAERWDDVAAVILAITAVLAGWAGYQAARWSGIQTQHITASTALHARSSLAAATTVLDVQIDMTAFVAWTQALSTGDLEEAAFHADRFRPELRHAFDAWLGDVTPTDVTELPPGLPMDTEAYDLEAQRAVEELVRLAEDRLDLAFEADRVAEVNVLMTVVLSMALFLAGIAARFREPRLKAGLTMLASVVLGLSVVVMATLPQASVSDALGRPAASPPPRAAVLGSKAAVPAGRAATAAVIAAPVRRGPAPDVHPHSCEDCSSTTRNQRSSP